MDNDKINVFDIAASSIAFIVILIASVLVFIHSYEFAAFALYLTAAFLAFSTYEDIREYLEALHGLA